MQASWRRRPSSRGPARGWSHPTIPPPRSDLGVFQALLSQVRVAGFRAARRGSGHTVNVHCAAGPGGPGAETGRSLGCECPAQIPLGPAFSAPASAGGRPEPCVSSSRRGPVVASLLPFSRTGAHLPIAVAERLWFRANRGAPRWVGQPWVGCPLPGGAECPRRSAGPPARLPEHQAVRVRRGSTEAEAAEHNLSPRSGGKLVAMRPPITCQCFSAAAATSSRGSAPRAAHPPPVHSPRSPVGGLSYKHACAGLRVHACSRVAEEMLQSQMRDMQQPRCPGHWDACLCCLLESFIASWHV